MQLLFPHYAVSPLNNGFWIVAGADQAASGLPEFPAIINGPYPTRDAAQFVLKAANACTLPADAGLTPHHSLLQPPSMIDLASAMLPTHRAPTADRLYNCQPGGKEPDWSQWSHLELGGCYDSNGDKPTDETNTVGGIAAADAEFFTVYGRGHLRDGEALAEAITDITDPREALAVAAQLAARSGLRVIVCVDLASDV